MTDALSDLEQLPADVNELKEMRKEWMQNKAVDTVRREEWMRHKAVLVFRGTKVYIPLEPGLEGGQQERWPRGPGIWASERRNSPSHGRCERAT